MSSIKQNMETKVWEIVGGLRMMDSCESRSDVLGLIFYKYLSESLETRMNEMLASENIEFEHLTETGDENLVSTVKKRAIDTCGYYIEPEYLFNELARCAQNGEDILKKLQAAFSSLYESSKQAKEDKLANIFEDINMDEASLGNSKDRNEEISSIILNLYNINLNRESEDKNAWGDVYEYLIGQFASDAGKVGEFYTPWEVSNLLVKLATMDSNKTGEAYDPACGSGSLLLQVANETEISRIYGQELDPATYNMARMNMIVHGIASEDFEIEKGDSLENPGFLEKKFDLVVSNPPLGARWSSDKKFMDDPRFSEYKKLAPKSKADYAFVQHMLYHLKDNGTMAVVLPHGVLFREAAEAGIRRHILEQNQLDAVIGLPSNLFYSTSIPVCILIFKKCRKEDDDILFVDASKDFGKTKKHQNKLRQQDIEKIVETYKNREEIPKYSHKATLQEIQENDYNLNIPRYVDTFEEEEPLDIREATRRLREIDSKINKINEKIGKCLDRLEIEPPTR